VPAEPGTAGSSAVLLTVLFALMAYSRMKEHRTAFVPLWDRPAW
jgi:hypothetical protein